MKFQTRLLTTLAFSMAATSGASAAPVFFDGSLYEFVGNAMRWDDAKATAATMTWNGFPGSLATVTSRAEDDFIKSIIPSESLVSIGASDAVQEGTWIWETGPEKGTVFWKDGAPVPGMYNNWRPGEPNAFYPTEDHLTYYRGAWVDSAGNDFLMGGFVVEYRLTSTGFDFGMTNGQMGAVRNISPQARLIGLDIALAGDTFFDSAATDPGREFSAWSLIDASSGIRFVRPDNAATDGQQGASLALDLDPTEALSFQVDLDRFAALDGEGIAPGTKLTGHFLLGDLEYTVTGVVGVGSIDILGMTFPYSVRSMNVVPEPGTGSLLLAGLCGLLGIRRWRSGQDSNLRPVA